MTCKGSDGIQAPADHTFICRAMFDPVSLILFVERA
jgi:hypothetical protein